MRQVQKYAFIVSGVFLLWCAAHAVVKPTGGAGRIIEDFSTIPLEVKGWTGIRGEFDKVSVESLKHCALGRWEYEDKSGYDSEFAIVYGVDLGDFHQPEVCLEGQGWRRTVSREVTVASDTPHKAILLNMSNDYGQDIVVLYWFASEGYTTNKLDSHKIDAFMSRLHGDVLKPSAMVRFISAVEGDCKTVEDHTLDLASKIDPYVSQIVSKPAVFAKPGKVMLGE